MHAGPVEYKTSIIMPLAPISMPGYAATAVFRLGKGRMRVRRRVRESPYRWSAPPEAAIFPRLNLQPSFNRVAASPNIPLESNVSATCIKHSLSIRRCIVLPCVAGRPIHAENR
jgi:hypothetical protein